MALYSDSASLELHSIPRRLEQTSNYLLPSFQRRFVWDEDNVLALLDSIKNGYPIGNIILWRKPEGYDPEEIDPLSKPIIGGMKRTASATYFVIDGQQRLTALLLAFNSWKIRRGKEIIEIKVPSTSAILVKKGEEVVELKVDGVFIEVGETPSTDLFKKAGVEVDEKNFIKVDPMQRTSIEGVFAAGDCTGRGLQVVVAAGDGAVAALSAYKYIKSTFK